MTNIIKFNLKKQFKSVVIYLASLIGTAWMYIGLFPSMQKIDFQSMIEQMPKELQGFMGEQGASAYNTIEGFLSGEFYSFFFLLLVGFYVAAVAGSAIAGSIEKRTMDFELSQPVSRTNKIIAETVVALSYSFVLVFVTNIAVKILCELYNIEIQMKGLLFLSIVSTFLLWSLYGLALFLSSFLRSKITVIGLSVFVILGSWIFYSLSLAVDKISKYGNYTMFHFFEPQKLLNSSINTDSIIVFLSAFLMFLTSSLIIFNRKDV